jgi:Mrp family chromosome partitioning ATPase
MHEPFTRSERQLRKHKLLSSLSGAEVLRAFSGLSYGIMQKHQNAVIVVTSITRRGGASLVAGNLAIALASYERNTALLLDCHGRSKSPYSFLYKGRTRQGLSEYLLNPDLDESEIICAVGVPKLRVVPWGSQKIRGERYASARMMEFVSKVQHRYQERYIVIDAPPADESVHAVLLSQLADAVLVVVPYGRVEAASLASTAAAFESKKFLGFVFNCDLNPSI